MIPESEKFRTIDSYRKIHSLVDINRLKYQLVLLLNVNFIKGIKLVSNPLSDPGDSLL